MSGLMQESDMTNVAASNPGSSTHSSDSNKYLLTLYGIVLSDSNSSIQQKITQILYQLYNEVPLESIDLLYGSTSSILPKPFTLSTLSTLPCAISTSDSSLSAANNLLEAQYRASYGDVAAAEAYNSVLQYLQARQSRLTPYLRPPLLSTNSPHIFSLHIRCYKPHISDIAKADVHVWRMIEAENFEPKWHMSYLGKPGQRVN